MQRFFKVTSVFCAVVVVAAMAWAAGPNEEFDPAQGEIINDFTVQYSYDPDGTLIAEVTAADGSSHLHAIGTRGFWGYVKNRTNPVLANVAINLPWSTGDRTTVDVNSCSSCGFYYQFCSVESGYHMMASLETTGGHSPLTAQGYRCADELIRQDFDFNVTLFYAKFCP